MKPRIVLFSGKGGVGKTSVAAATGVRAAELGYRTLVMSLDIAHSLSDAFDLPVGLHDKNKGQPVPVADSLWIQEIDVQEEMERYWGEIYKYIASVFRSAGLEDIMVSLGSLLPEPETQQAIGVLRRDFVTHDAVGPRRAAEFIHGAPDDATQADVVGFVTRLLHACERWGGQ